MTSKTKRVPSIKRSESRKSDDAMSLKLALSALKQENLRLQKRIWKIEAQRVTEKNEITLLKAEIARQKHGEEPRKELDMSSLSDDELRTFIELTKKIQAANPKF